jgi:hypothetical protein
MAVRKPPFSFWEWKKAAECGLGKNRGVSLNAPYFQYGRLMGVNRTFSTFLFLGSNQGFGGKIPESNT